MAIKEKKIIVAMKGHPGTGKSTLAQSLASTLRIPLVDKDDVRDGTSPLQRALLLASNPTTASTLLNDLSYDVLFRVASTQLRLGLSVVLDSPLSRRAHLDRLVQTASSAGACVFVVECKPNNEAEWRRRLERRGAGAADCEAGWHKPATWRDLERLLEGYAGCTEYDVGDVPRLVVDTTASVEVGELVSSVVQFIASHAEGWV
jgi:predicted kinase